MAKLVMDQMDLRLAARKIDDLSRDLLALNERLQHQASHDPMTRLWNRAAIMELLKQTHSRAVRERRAISVMMLDIDHFKTINDTLGHPAGDQVIVEVSRRLRESLRTDDFIGRIGGEEFLAILYPCDLNQTRTLGERCRRAICDHPILTDEGPVEVTISLGAFASSSSEPLLLESLLRTVDRALYQSKKKGRNRATVLA